ncbi:hypothetical protein R1sor_002244 [Riccia sorocarpa]|uniref:AAA+ ATPase domain-containing protein n=1 Tax=Riccia sorocarpa TaxID=122646 RepID=A0ABD3H0U6_9MARC
MPVMDTCRPKRARKLSLSLSGKVEGREKKGEDEKMKRDCEDQTEGGSSSEDQTIPSSASPSLAVSPPRECKVPKVRNTVKSSPPQKPPSNSRRRRVQDKNCAQENGTNSSSNELTRMTISETFFMPVSKKRKLLAEENKTENKAENKAEALKAVPAEVPPAKASIGSSEPLVEPTLREKAAVLAKEEAVRNAGKAIYPLFLRAKTSGTKATATCSEVVLLEPCPPTHVTQRLEEDNMELNLGINYVHQSPSMERCKEEELVHCLKRRGHSLGDDLLMGGSSQLTWQYRESLSADPSPPVPSTARKLLSVSHDISFQQSLEDLLEYLKEAAKSRSKLFGASLQPPSDATFDESISVEKLRERLSWYIDRRASLLPLENKDARSSSKNMLWIDVYEPRSAKEVCGNATGVEFLNSWMRSWRERMMGQANGSEMTQKAASASTDDSDCDRGWFEGDSEVDSDDDQESGLHSTLLITGPTGSGKTAAIYACAAEHGFTVIEVNASSTRSGASLMQKFGRGGLESQAMGKWSTVEDQGEDKDPTVSHTRDKHVPNVQGRGKKDGRPRASRNPGVVQDKFPTGRRPFDSSASSESNSNVNTEDPQAGNPQKKKLTVILFEDVDLQFEEDKGFWTALIQLAKKTKRPIILTTNSHQPGLPQLLEKARIDFYYPSPQQLTLHASMISIAEGVACSPWMVNRLVESCRCDIRKLIMALQFWKQDACSSPVSIEDTTPCASIDSDTKDIITGSGNENCSEARRRLSLRRPDPNVNCLSFPAGESENKCLTEGAGGVFSQWDLNARYLYDLDAHHTVLPQVFSTSDPCALSLNVAGKISGAVTELENQASLAAARDAELQGLALQALLDATEAERKAQRKLKDLHKRASRLKPKVIQDKVAVISDTKGESPAVKSPTKGIRQARALARSPVKLKMQRRLLLSNSDNEEEPQADDDDVRCVSGVNPSDGVEVTEVEDTIEADPADVVISDSMEDTDSTVVIQDKESCESVATGRKLRLRQVRETNLRGSTVQSECHELPSSSSYVEIPSRVSEAELNEKDLSDELPPVLGLSFRVEGGPADQDQSHERVVSSPRGKKGEETSTLSGEGVVSGLDLNLEPRSEYEGDTELVDSGNVKWLPGCKDSGCTAVRSLCSPGVSRMTGASLGDGTPRLESDLDRGASADKSGSCVEDSASRSSFSQVKLSGSCNGCDTDVGKFLENECEVIDPVQEAWKALRAERDSRPPQPLPVQPKTHELGALAKVVDAFSASDTISSSSSELSNTARTTLCGEWNGAFEGNIGHCSYWEGCQEIASQLVRASLRASSTEICSDKKLSVTLGILLTAKDVPAVGKCIISCDDVKTIRNLESQLGSSGECCMQEDCLRQSRRYQRLDEIISTRFHPKGRITAASFVDYVAYLALINQREEERRESGTDNRRARRFQHHLGSKISNADLGEFSALCRFEKA